MPHLACPRTSPSLPSNAGSETRCQTIRHTMACSRGRTQSAVGTAPAAQTRLEDAAATVRTERRAITTPSAEPRAAQIGMSASCP